MGENAYLAPVNMGAVCDALGDGTRRLLGMSTGWDEWDRLTGGLYGIIGMCGRPGAGKTSIALHFARQAAAAGCPVLYYALEMSVLRLTVKLLAQLSGVPSEDILLRGKVLLQAAEAAPVGVSADAVLLAEMFGGGLCDETGEPVAEANIAAAGRNLRDARDAALWRHIHIFDGVTEGRRRIDADTIGRDVQALGPGVRPFVVIDHLNALRPAESTGRGSQKEQIDAALETLRDTSKLCAGMVLLAEQNRSTRGVPLLGAFMGSADVEHTCDYTIALVSERDEWEKLVEENDGELPVLKPWDGWADEEHPRGTSYIDAVVTKHRDKDIPPKPLPLKMYGPTGAIDYDTYRAQGGPAGVGIDDPRTLAKMPTVTVAKYVRETTTLRQVEERKKKAAADRAAAKKARDEREERAQQQRQAEHADLIKAMKAAAAGQ